MVHIRDDFYGSDDPTNSVKALKDNCWSVHQVKGQSHQTKPKPKTDISKLTKTLIIQTAKTMLTEMTSG